MIYNAVAREIIECHVNGWLLADWLLGGCSTPPTTSGRSSVGGGADVVIGGGVIVARANALVSNSASSHAENRFVEGVALRKLISCHCRCRRCCWQKGNAYIYDVRLPFDMW